jgi:hypothetical protein
VEQVGSELMARLPAASKTFRCLMHRLVFLVSCLIMWVVILPLRFLSLICDDCSCSEGIYLCRMWSICPFANAKLPSPVFSLLSDDSSRLLLGLLIVQFMHK